MSHVLVSGGSRGIGASIVSFFAKKNYNVTFFYQSRIDPKDILERFDIGIRDRLLPLICDCSIKEEVTEGVRQAISMNGDIDILVSNCGVSISGLCSDYTYEEYRRVLDTNFGSLFFLTQEVVPNMVHRKKGSIVAISSMWGQTGSSYESLYSASKGAIDAYVKSLAKELGPSSIRVNAVSPGVVNTDMLNVYSEKDKESLAQETPLERLGEPLDIAKAVHFLATDESSFVTGQILGVNGGFLI